MSQIASKPRQKVWATRARTGCLTCRVRHVKCDETRPECRRCLRGKKVCQGYTLPAPPQLHQSASGSAYSGSGDVFDAVQIYPARVTVEAEPPDWDHLEAIRYYHTFLKPPDVDSPYYVDWKFTAQTHVPVTFICVVLCMRIDALSNSLRRLLRPGDGGVALRGLWARYHRYVLEHLRQLNLCIGGDERYGGGWRVFFSSPAS
ncbi:hypothetical protein NLG97_g5699 [Lecanicillium saksenae]|uniref:Uncharacterized protein n=1 Tax=Lecanicillium saksenae TaxID=468837 RepID=A0ACC1QTF1_9HYPO|nr:hypothetical protein NLG97_g5699 [Lecanicillium saksenae]